MRKQQLPVELNPSGVQDLIKNFFICFSAKQIEETLFEMLQDSITNPDCPTEAEANYARCFAYREVSKLLCELEKFKPLNHATSCKN